MVVHASADDQGLARYQDFGTCLLSSGPQNEVRRGCYFRESEENRCRAKRRCEKFEYRVSACALEAWSASSQDGRQRRLVQQRSNRFAQAPP